MFPVGFCGAGLSKKALAELDLLANKQRSCSHREPRPGQYRPPTERGREEGERSRRQERREWSRGGERGEVRSGEEMTGRQSVQRRRDAEDE